MRILALSFQGEKIKNTALLQALSLQGEGLSYFILQPSIDS
jgi:hypothetical protein